MHRFFADEGGIVEGRAGLNAEYSRHALRVLRLREGDEVELVCAPQQARFAEKLLPLLTEDEASVFRRGRNANVHSIPHHADRADYQKATGLEALFGWLYLRDDHARINELFNRMMEDDNAT